MVSTIFIVNNLEGETMKATGGNSLWLRLAAVVAAAFGVLTIKEGGTVLFGGDAARNAAGNYVPFVLWFNFVAGFAYVAAGIGLWRRQRWALWLALAIVTGTLIVFAAFGAHILGSGAYEQRTVIAMSLRSVVWAAISVIAYQSMRRGA